MTPAYTRRAAWLLAALFIFGILTLWVRGRWAVAVFESGVLLLALVWCWLNAWLKGPVRWHPALLPLAFIPLWGLVQLAAGLTLMPWLTSEKLLEWTAVFFAAFLMVQACASQRVLYRLPTALLIFAALIGVLSILQLFTSQGRFLWLFDTGYTSEVLGPFVSRNKYAQFVEIVFPLALWRAISERRMAPLWLTVAAILGAGVVAGASRSGAALLLVEIAAVLLLAWRRQALAGRSAAFAALFVTALVSLWGFLVGWDLFWERLIVLDPLADHRWPINSASLQMIRHYPWFGVGLGAWPAIYPEFATFDIGVFVNQAHCDWLQWTAEGGLPMLAAILAFVAIIARGLIRSVWGIGFLVVLLHAAVDYPFQQLPAFTAFLFSAALLAAPHERGQAG